MKQTLFLATLCVVILLSCQSESKPAVVKSDSAVAKEPIAYPFTAKYSLNWQPGDEKNALIVLNCLKHYVDSDMKGAFVDFADTVDFYSDGFHFKGSKDSLQTIIGTERNALASVSKSFDTWLTAYYPDNGENWVTLWYTETTTNKKGKTDSLFYVDDVLIKNGKILEYDEKIRHFPKAAAKK
jgi:hypothetical protein